MKLLNGVWGLCATILLMTSDNDGWVGGSLFLQQTQCKLKLDESLDLMQLNLVKAGRINKFKKEMLKHYAKKRNAIQFVNQKIKEINIRMTCSYLNLIDDAEQDLKELFAPNVKIKKEKSHEERLVDRISDLT